MNYRRQTRSYDSRRGAACPATVSWDGDGQPARYSAAGREVILAEAGHDYAVLDRMFAALSVRSRPRPQQNYVATVSTSCPGDCRVQVCALCEKHSPAGAPVIADDLERANLAGAQVTVKGNEPLAGDFTLPAGMANRCMVFTKGFGAVAEHPLLRRADVVGLEMVLVPGREDEISAGEIRVDYTATLDALGRLGKPVILYAYIVAGRNETLIPLTQQLLEEHEQVKAVVFESRGGYSTEGLFAELCKANVVSIGLPQLYEFQYLVMALFQLFGRCRCFYNFLYAKYRAGGRLRDIGEVVNLDWIRSALPAGDPGRWWPFRMVAAFAVRNPGFMLRHAGWLLRRMLSGQLHDLRGTRPLIPIGINAECAGKGVFDAAIARFCATGTVCPGGRRVERTAYHECAAAAREQEQG